VVSDYSVLVHGREEGEREGEGGRRRRGEGQREDRGVRGRGGGVEVGTKSLITMTKVSGGYCMSDLVIIDVSGTPHYASLVSRC